MHHLGAFLSLAAFKVARVLLQQQVSRLDPLGMHWPVHAR